MHTGAVINEELLKGTIKFNPQEVRFVSGGI